MTAAHLDGSSRCDMPTSLKRGAIAYLLVATLLSAVAFLLHLRAATLTGLHRTVHATSRLLEPPLMDGPAQDVTLDFVDAEPDLPARFYVLWRGFWFLPSARTVQLVAHADDRVTVWINGQRLLHWRLGTTAAHGTRRSVTLPAGFNSLAVEYEQLGGRHEIMLHGDGLKRYRLFRSPVSSVDTWLVSAAARTRAAAAVLWLTLLVLGCPLAVAAIVLEGRPPASVSDAVTATRSTLRELWRRVAAPYVSPWCRAPDWRTEGGRLETAARRALPFAFGVFLVSGVLDTVHRYRVRDGFAFGDWLINYQGGFVRRGLLGEVIYQLHLTLGGNPGLYVLLLQLALYSVFLVFSFLLLRRQNLVAYAPLILVPFTFMYHDEVGFRKEQVFLTFLALSVWLLHTRAVKGAFATFAVLLVLYPAAVLSHEMLLVFLPYLLATYALTGCWNRRQRTTWVIALSCLSAACFSAVLLYGRTAGFGVPRILESLSSAGYPVGGAIGSLNDSMSAAYTRVKEVYVWGNYANYLPAAALVAAGFFSVRERLRYIASNRICLSLVIASVVLSLPLFAFAHDWGRFIRTHAVALLLLSLGIANIPPGNRGRKSTTEGTPIAAAVRAVAWSVAVLIYASFWRLAPYGDVTVLVAEPYYVTSLRRSLELLAGMVN